MNLEAMQNLRGGTENDERRQQEILFTVRELCLGRDGALPSLERSLYGGLREAWFPFETVSRRILASRRRFSKSAISSWIVCD